MQFGCLLFLARPNLKGPCPHPPTLTCTTSTKEQRKRLVFLSLLLHFSCLDGCIYKCLLFLLSASPVPHHCPLPVGGGARSKKKGTHMRDDRARGNQDTEGRENAERIHPSEVSPYQERDLHSIHARACINAESTNAVRRESRNTTRKRTSTYGPNTHTHTHTHTSAFSVSIEMTSHSKR